MAEKTKEEALRELLKLVAESPDLAERIPESRPPRASVLQALIFCDHVTKSAAQPGGTFLLPRFLTFPQRQVRACYAAPYA